MQLETQRHRAPLLRLQLCVCANVSVLMCVSMCDSISACVCAYVIVCASLVHSLNFTSLSSVHRGFGKQGFQCQGKSSGSFTNPSAAYGCVWTDVPCLKECCYMRVCVCVFCCVQGFRSAHCLE